MPIGDFLLARAQKLINAQTCYVLQEFLFRSHCFFVSRSEVATKYHVKKLLEPGISGYLGPPAGLWAMARGTWESSMLEEGFKDWVPAK